MGLLCSLLGCRVIKTIYAGRLAKILYFIKKQGDYYEEIIIFAYCLLDSTCRM